MPNPTDRGEGVGTAPQVGRQATIGDLVDEDVPDRGYSRDSAGRREPSRVRRFSNKSAGFIDQEFADKTIPLDGRRFERCRFIRCELEFTGRQAPELVDCVFEACIWSFVDSAETTLAFVTELVSALGSAGEELRRRVFFADESDRLAGVT